MLDILVILVFILSLVLFALSLCWWIYSQLYLSFDETWNPFFFSMGSGVWLLLLCLLSCLFI